METKISGCLTTDGNRIVDRSGMNSLEIFDLFVRLTRKYGMRIIIDIHSAKTLRSTTVSLPTTYGWTVPKQQISESGSQASLMVSSAAQTTTDCLNYRCTPRNPRRS